MRLINITLLTLTFSALPTPGPEGTETDQSYSMEQFLKHFHYDEDLKRGHPINIGMEDYWANYYNYYSKDYPTN
jgi:hypothetical protein